MTKLPVIRHGGHAASAPDDDDDAGDRSPRRLQKMEAAGPRRSPIEQAMLRLRDTQVQFCTSKIRASFARMDDTARLFQIEYEETCAMLARVQAHQEEVATACFHVVEDSVVTVQRVIRGFLARRLFRQAVTLKAAVRVQRAFRAAQRRRAERLRRFRVLCRKWRLAMGIGETDSDLMNALYRRKFMRGRIADLFRSVRTMALREDLERRGLLAIRDLQSRKEEEVRKQEAAHHRVQDAKKRIATETLSDETRLLLLTKKK
ncbi:hypothetical protein ATCC90586_000958 [Pythium insidiosum]|nr:hypothetical protein ATCC90586_000958 [Pythium insidiosum]